ncbi:hypothetical protein BDQ17DRAFT_1359628 [Cyathus striatus]|nr:hypothetical protein BDQ17DRAFT_1359628 [Cyathus striatus]
MTTIPDSIYALSVKLDRIEKRIDETKSEINARLDKIEARCLRLERLAVFNNNISHDRFVIMPFADGSLPTEPPHNLPAIKYDFELSKLSEADSIAYYQGYYPGKEVPRGENNQQILVAILEAMRSP